MKRIFLGALIVIAFGSFAEAQMNGCPAGLCNGVCTLFGGGGLCNGPAGGAPAPTGKILLVDGASFILQTDAASKVCLAGGC